MRQLVDALGREWHVYERREGPSSPAGERPSLVFDTEGIVRRLWDYPRSWQELPDDALLALMDDSFRLRKRAC